MKQTRRATPRPRRLSWFVVAAAAALAAYAAPAVQTAAQAPASSSGKKALKIEDYGRWRTINGSQMSGDGKWVVFGLAFTNVAQAETKPVLTILNLETDQKVEIQDATGASFSPDSMWIAYTVEPGGA